ncbi:hypothetical protein HDU79_003963 [Rhizoclosmatium sp. JEL0117]|nr:hypothetical protein HDU79_003963 [Rhizoclosmatium sp. JEL0117]
MALVSSHHATSQLDRYERPPKTTPQTAEAPPKYFETFRGFCKNKHDAQILVEACVAGYLFPLNVIPVDLSAMRLQSGTIIVFAESTSHTQMMRWRDGCRWSPSRVNGQFLLYREVESTKKPPSTAIVEESTRFNTPVPRPNTRLVPHGFAKRTISVQGSNGQNYRVISYFYPKDIAHLYGDDEESDDTPVNLKRHDRLDIQTKA